MSICVRFRVWTFGWSPNRTFDGRKSNPRFPFKSTREHHPNEYLCTHVEAVQKQLEIFIFTCLQNLFSNQVQIKSNIRLVQKTISKIIFKGDKIGRGPIHTCGFVLTCMQTEGIWNARQYKNHCRNWVYNWATCRAPGDNGFISQSYNLSF